MAINMVWNIGNSFYALYCIYRRKMHSLSGSSVPTELAVGTGSYS